MTRLRIPGPLYLRLMPGSEVSSYRRVDRDEDDSLGRVCIFERQSSMYHATNSSGSWVSSTVENTGTFEYVYYTSIALDASNNVHIAYYEANNSELKYARNSSGSWVAEMVESNGTVGEYNSVAVDSTGKVHISYYDSSNSCLK